MKRALRITLGLALIGYAVYSGNAWFYLGVIPLIFGFINWCPMEKIFGVCGKDSQCCGTTSNSCCSPKEETVSSESKCCGGVKEEAAQTKSGCCGSDSEGAVKIEILGTGCAKCKALEAAAKEAVSKIDGSFCVEKVEDIQKITAYGVMSTPALVIDGKVVSTGKLLSVDEIVELIKAR